MTSLTPVTASFDAAAIAEFSVRDHPSDELIHISQEVARARGLKDIVAQSMMAYGLALRMLTDAYGEDRWFAGGDLNLAFLRSIYRGDSVTVTGVPEVAPAADAALRIVVECRNQDGELVAAGEALLPRLGASN